MQSIYEASNLERDRVRQYLLNLVKDPSNPIPSLRKVSAILGVSRSTVAWAAHKLRADGLIAFSHGKSPGRPGAPCESLPEPKPAQRCLDTLREAIIDGEYRSGDAMPKRAAIAREFGISDHTVSAIYRKLGELKLVHKKGKRWIIGQSTASVATRFIDGPVILLLQINERSWRSLYSSERTGSFCRSFQDEAVRNGIQILPCFTTPDATPSRAFVGGSAAIVKLATRLGSRYLGTLIVGDTSDIPDLQEWVFSLSVVGKPVVWFDRNGRESPQLWKKIRHASIARFNEEAALTACLKVLRDLGHRTIGFPVLWPRAWRPQREELLRRIAQERFPEITILKNPPVEDIIMTGADEIVAIVTRLYHNRIPEVRSIFRFLCTVLTGRDQGLPAFRGDRLTDQEIAMLVSIAEDPGRRVRSYHKYLFRFTPLLIPHIANREVSALIAPCDSDALHIYYWLQAAQIKVPHQISLISFDNYPDVVPLPVTTIDFGFGNLGYAAFHAILQDLPVRRDSHGAINSRPEIVNRGSVAPKG